MKIIAAHQPAYIPWLGYFHKILLSDEFVIMDDVQFEKNSFINRNKIIFNGREVMLTIPVLTKGYTQKRIKDIEILHKHWKSKHLKTVEQAYKKKPFFSEVFHLLEKSLSAESNFLVDYTNSFLFNVLKYLGIDTPVHVASDYAIKSKKLDYVIELTHKFNGNAFVFGALGKKYASGEELVKANIKPFFQQYVHPVYGQDAGNFVPFLSILDLMMYKGKASLDVIASANLSKTELINSETFSSTDFS